MTKPRRSLRWIAPLLLACSACDTAEPDVELREGQTLSFKTTNTDQSFTWKGCEPPWGPDPYSPEAYAPDDRWLGDLDAKIGNDARAHALSGWRKSEASRECDVGCADMGLAWTGDARPDEARHERGKLQVLGHCDDKTIAVEVEVSLESSFLCACAE